MMRSDEEQSLLNKLASGELDGIVGDVLTTSGKSSVWKKIENGIPRNLKQGPTTKFFNNEENERVPGILHVLQTWETDEEKLDFLRRFGWLMNDQEVRSYSAKYKPSSK